MTLRPTFTWHPVPRLCADQTFQVQLENSCAPGQFAQCAFASPEVDAIVSSTTTSFTPATALPVSATPPVGAFYAWRVRACAGAGQCGAWSDTSYLNVGRVREDLNGDGFADLLAGSQDDSGRTRLEVYPGAATPAVVPALNLAANCLANAAYFLGDVNGDGFGDFVCGTLDGPNNRATPIVTLGGANLAALSTVALTSEQAGATSATTSGPGGDFNGDGFADIVVAFAAGGASTRFNLRVHFGSQVFADAPAPLQILGPLATFSTDWMRDTGDLNGDGYTDLGLFHDGLPQSSLLQLCMGGAIPDLVSEVTASSSSYIVASPLPSGDLDGDGYVDLLVPYFSAGYGISRGGSPLPSSVTMIATTGSVVLSGFDLNADRNADFLVRTSSGNVLVLGGASPVMVPGALSHVTGDLATYADYNGDGRIDFAVGDTTNHQASRLFGDGTLDPPASSLVGPSDGASLSGSFAH